MFDKKVCETISSRIKTIWMFDEAKSLRDMYAMALGELDMDVLEALKNRHLHEFGFTVEMVPDKEMLNDLKKDLNIALQEQTIDLSEKYQILELAKSNYKKAFEYMRFIRNRRLKQKAQEQQENMRLQSESNIASTQAAEEAKVKGYQTTKAVDLDYEKQMAQIRLMEHKAKLEIELPKEQREFEEEVYIEKIKNLNLSDLTEYKEKAKDERTKLQASQQSKMIDQRNNSKEQNDIKNAMSAEQWALEKKQIENAMATVETPDIFGEVYTLMKSGKRIDANNNVIGEGLTEEEWLKQEAKNLPRDIVLELEKIIQKGKQGGMSFTIVPN
jgi:hypothetical protein